MASRKPTLSAQSSTDACLPMDLVGDGSGSPHRHHRPLAHLASHYLDSALADLSSPPPAPSVPVDCHTQRNYWKLVFKITIVFLSFAGFLYQATDICAHYFSYRTVVYTNTEQDSLVDLPSITFCLPTYFTKRTLEELYAPYIKRNVDETAAFKNHSMLEAIKPVIYETFQKQAFKDLSAAEILDRSISDDGIIECRLFYPPQHWPNLTRERMYEIVQYGLPCEEVTQVIPSINANGKCFTFFSQLLTDNDSLKAYQQHQSSEAQVEYQQYPQMTSFATSSASSASTRSSGPVAPPIVQHSRYAPVSHKISVNQGYRFHSGRFIRLQVQFNRDQYTVISDGHQRECIQVHPPFKIPSEACLHSINPGMSYDFVLTKTKAILQPPPYQTNCQSYQAVTQAESELLATTSDPADLQEFYLKPMSRSDCIDKCMIHIYEKYCGCLPIHISIWQRSSLFLNMSVCDYEDFERISPCLEKELSSTCYDTCKSDCIDRHYHLHVESRVYPSDEQIKQVTGVERTRLERLRQSAATISIWSNYLSDITYVHTPAMSLIQLICYLGGLAGLWLGVSVMTVSGWLAQLYPFMQKWNYKQRYILLSCRRNVKCMFESIRHYHHKSDYSQTDTNATDCCYTRQDFLANDKVSDEVDSCLEGDGDMVGNSATIARYANLEHSVRSVKNCLLDNFASPDSAFDSVSTDSGVISTKGSISSADGDITVMPGSGNVPASGGNESTPVSGMVASQGSTVANRRSVYWSNYSSMSTSSDDISLISSSTSSTNASTTSAANISHSSAFRRMSFCSGSNQTNTSGLAKYSYKV